MNDEKFNVTYEVCAIKFRSDTYTIFKAYKVDFDEGYEKDLAEYTIKGNFESIDVGDRLKSYAHWVCDKKYGWQLESEFYTVVVPSDEKGMRRFLMRFVKGIGKKTADNIVNKFGTDCLDVIKNDYARLTEIKGITEKKAQKIYEQVLEHASIEELSVFLFSKGVTNYNDVVTIYNEFGVNAIDIIKINPYVLCDKISISFLKYSDSIALSLGFTYDNPIRIHKLVQYYIFNKTVQNGDMYVPFKVLEGEIKGFLTRQGINTEGLTISSLNNAIIELENNNIIVLEDTLNGADIYPVSLYEVETESARIINEFLSEPKTEASESTYISFFEDFEKKNGIILDEEQKNAVRFAYENRISILTGGAGTGKTQSVKAVIAFIKKYDRKAKIKLCAPTGRAAKRMSELTYMKSSTIHKMLKIGVDENIDIEDVEEFEADYIICDESSMTDAVVFHKLLMACEASGAKLFLVGDKDQLAPVGPGAFFADLIKSGLIPLVSLKTLHRQAAESQINLNARKILDGVKKTDEDNLLVDIDKQDFFMFPTTSPEKITQLIEKSIKSLINLGTNPDDIMVISPTKKTLLGVKELNTRIQAILNPANYDKDEIKIGNTIYRVGDRVMQIANDYDLNVFNGDIGKVSRIDYNGIDGEEIVIEYEDVCVKKENGKEIIAYETREVSYTRTLASELSLAYAITVHKSQGCEFKCVITPMSRLFNPKLVTKNLIYTDVTRARERYVMIGDIDVFYEGISRLPENKCSKLIQRLKGTP